MFVRRLQLGLCLVGFGLLTNLSAGAEGQSNISQAVPEQNVSTDLRSPGIAESTEPVTEARKKELGFPTFALPATWAEAEYAVKHAPLDLDQIELHRKDKQIEALQNEIDGLKKLDEEQQSQATSTKGKKAAQAFGRYLHEAQQRNREYWMTHPAIGSNQYPAPLMPPVQPLMMPYTMPAAYPIQSYQPYPGSRIYTVY